MPLSSHDEHILELVFGPDKEDECGVPLTAISPQEVEAVKLAEKGQLDDALKIFSALVNSNPDDPSPLNNRAQIYRMMHRDDQSIRDLEICMDLTLDKPEYKGIRRRALMQRGWLELKINGEESAGPYFEEAGELGSLEARRLAVRCNPYAAMCNRMLQQMMQRYFSVPNN
jgi:hypothetical protein